MQVARSVGHDAPCTRDSRVHARGYDCCCCCCCNSNICLPTRSYTSMYLATHRSMQTDSALVRSDSRCFGGRHFVAHDRVILRRARGGAQRLDRQHAHTHSRAAPPYLLKRVDGVISARPWPPRTAGQREGRWLPTARWLRAQGGERRGGKLTRIPRLPHCARPHRHPTTISLASRCLLSPLALLLLGRRVARVAGRRRRRRMTRGT